MARHVDSSRGGRVASKRFDPWHDSGALLVVIDEAPLKRAAWAELHAVRKRQEKAARDLHIILEVRDRGTPPTTRYRRIIVEVLP